MEIVFIDKKLALSTAIDDYNELQKKRIKYVINLRSEQHDDICELTKRKIGYFWIAIPDWAAPKADQIELFLTLMNHLKGKILVHCDSGKGRTGFMALAYLARTEQISSMDEGIKLVRDKGQPIDLWYTQRDKYKKHFGL